MMRALAAIGVVSLVLAGAAPAASADGTVAVLPFAADGRLALYGQPVAAQVAKVGREAGLEMVLLAAGAAVPADARLVVDGRLVKSGAAIVLEARVRDPERGLDVTRRSATAASLAVVDRAADDVAQALVPAIRAGLAAQDEARERAKAALTADARATSTGGARDAATARAGTGDATRPAAIDRRPLALIALSGAYAGTTRSGQDVGPLVAPSLVRLADRLGHRAAPLAPDRLRSPEKALAAGDARLAIIIVMLSVDVTGGPVPQGQARARVEAYDRSGLVYRRTVRTDTLVGSRGDREDTLVRAAVAQVIDVVAPRLRERLAASGARP